MTKANSIKATKDCFPIIKEYPMQTKIRHQPLDIPDNVFIVSMSLLVGLGLIDHKAQVSAKTTGRKLVQAAENIDGILSVKDA